MTNQEAIQILTKERLCVNRDCDTSRCNGCNLVMPSKEPIDEALNMAIKALEINESQRKLIRRQYDILLGEIQRQSTIVENIKEYVVRKYDLCSGNSTNDECEEVIGDILKFINSDIKAHEKDVSTTCEIIDDTHAD